MQRKKEKTAVIAVRLTQSDVAALDRVADRQDRARSYIARVAVKEFLERQEDIR